MRLNTESYAVQLGAGLLALSSMGIPGFFMALAIKSSDPFWKAWLIASIMAIPIALVAIVMGVAVYGVVRGLGIATLEFLRLKKRDNDF
jgi:ABC-type sulfate transport system permease component